MTFANFEERVAFYLAAMSPAERRVAKVLLEAREDVLVASAASLAIKANTSDATVVRTVQTLGLAGMDELRRTLAAELKQTLTIAKRLTKTLQEVGDDLHAAFNVTLDIQRDAIEALRREISPDLFRHAVTLISSARRVAIFGLGPSSSVADYFAQQLGRFGFDAICLTHTGALFADDLCRLRPGDVLIIMAYTRISRELTILLDEGHRLGIKSILLTDSLSGKLRNRVELVLPAARGRVDMLSMHTATLGLIEALLVGTAASHPKSAVRHLEALNALREQIVGEPVDLFLAEKQMPAGASSKTRVKGKTAAPRRRAVQSAASQRSKRRPPSR